MPEELAPFWESQKMDALVEAAMERNYPAIKSEVGTY
jgi:hypothetical protein